MGISVASMHSVEDSTPELAVAGLKLLVTAANLVYVISDIIPTTSACHPVVPPMPSHMLEMLGHVGGNAFGKSAAGHRHEGAPWQEASGRDLPPAIKHPTVLPSRNFLLSDLTEFYVFLCGHAVHNMLNVPPDTQPSARGGLVRK